MFDELNRAHARLDELLAASGDAVFLGEPVASHDLLGDRLTIRQRPTPDELLPYAALMDHDGLAADIVAAHTRLDGVAPDPVQLAPAVGATALLTAVTFWISTSIYADDVLYVPPVFHRLGSWLDRFGVTATPLTDTQPWEPEFTLPLPDRRSMLILTDPVWFVGRPVPADVITTIRDWQQATDSMVLVDGTFQYLRWDGRAEHSVQLDPDRTIRMLSPNKSLGINGVRFAYAIAPPDTASALSRVIDDMHGPSTWYDVEAARLLTQAFADPAVRTPIAALARRRARTLADHVDGWVEPSAGYFIFANVNAPGTVPMGPDLFQLRGHTGFTRINVLNDAAFDAVRNLPRHPAPQTGQALYRPGAGP